ncbi:MAG: c-type cytochrome, partial [Verrucomicrobiae bacterium]|nr:c-type cytochrome [Verrucomicrobiae bacterium]
APSVRKAALIGLKAWETPIQTDPVNGHFRPLATEGEETDRSLTQLGETLGPDLREFLNQPHGSELITLGMELATATGVQLDPATLIAQVDNAALGSTLRIAVLDSLVRSKAEGVNGIVSNLLKNEDRGIRAAAMTHGFALDLDGISGLAKEAIQKDELVVARAAMEGLAKVEAPTIEALWKNRESELRRGLWLDAYLLLSAASHPEAAAYAAASPSHVFDLSLQGGDPAAGEVVFKNQGACLQCHTVGSEGGVQGPNLTEVAKRLSREKILEAVTNPGAEITEGYGMTTVSLKSGDSVVGRLSTQADDHVIVVGLDNQPTRLNRADIKEMAPPISAMPPMAMALPPKDLRNLIAFLAVQDGKVRKKNDSSHGDDEAIAK